MSKIKLAIVGITGRMGTELRALADEMGFVVTCGVSRSVSAMDVETAHAQFADIKLVSSMQEMDKSDADVVIDFSLPENLEAVVGWCEKNQRALVSGVTGLTEAHKARLQSAGGKTAVLWAPNMSLGVAVLARMLAKLEALEGFEFQIEELHHKRKKDAPSGTALFLQEHLEQAVGPAPAPVAIRGGGIFGIHRVWAMGEEETLTIEHNAMNRRVFARGGLKASAWILNQAPGFYRMDDVL